MRVLIGCEFSGAVREAFRAKGHEAWSCDLLPSDDNSPYHYQSDVKDILSHDWDLGIFHPPCTFLTLSAEWAYGDGPYHQKVKPETLTGAARRAARDEAVAFFQSLIDAPILGIAIENPVGCISSRIRKPDQIIQPYEFGSSASKKTCLWLKNVPKLIADPSNRVAGRMVEWPRGGGAYGRKVGQPDRQRPEQCQPLGRSMGKTQHHLSRHCAGNGGRLGLI